MPKRFSTARGREFGDALRKAIASAGFTSRALAEILGWDEAKLSDLINGKGGTSVVELGVWPLTPNCATPAATSTTPCLQPAPRRARAESPSRSASADPVVSGWTSAWVRSAPT